jgi:flagellar hook-length control protein FliK
MLMSRETTWKEPVASHREVSQKRAKPFTDASHGLPFGLFVEWSLHSLGNAAQPTQSESSLRTGAVEAAKPGTKALHGRLQSSLGPMHPTARQDGLSAAVSSGRVQADRERSVGGPGRHQVEGDARMQAVNESAVHGPVSADAHVLRANRPEVRAFPLPSAEWPKSNEGHNTVAARDGGAVAQGPHLPSREGGQALGDSHALRAAMAAEDFADGIDVKSASATRDAVSADQSGPGHTQVGLAPRPEVLWFAQAPQASPAASTVPGAAQPVVHLGQAQAPAELGQFVLQQVQTGPGEMRVKVHPEGMGDIVVAVFRSGDSIHVRLEANHAQTVHWLAQNADALAQAVKTSGVDLASVEVALGSASLSQSFQDDASSSRRQREGASRRDNGWTHSHRTEAGARFVAFDSGGLESRVNLQV